MRQTKIDTILEDEAVGNRQIMEEAPLPVLKFIENAEGQRILHQMWRVRINSECNEQWRPVQCDPYVAPAEEPPIPEDDGEQNGC